MIKTIKTFYFENQRVEEGEEINLIKFYPHEFPLSGIYVDVQFMRFNLFINLDASIIFKPEEIKLLKDPQQGQKFFELFKTGEHYGI